MRDWGAQAQRLVARRPHLLTYRRITRTSGPTPAVNPPNLAGSVTVSGNTAQGAPTITLAVTKVNGNGFLKAGDTFTIAGDTTVYTVGTDTQNSGNSFPNVPISPVLARAAADGAAVALTFAADTRSVPAAMASYPLGIINGTSIIMGDQRVIIAALDLPGITPVNGDVVIDGAVQRVIKNVNSLDSSVSVAWDLQAR